MASTGCHIPADEWSAHEETIRRLYYIEKLPVQSKKGHRCLVEVLEKEHGFSATPEQYESKFQEWGSAKNLKKREWQQLLAEHEYLTDKHIEARITVSGGVVDEAKIKRQRRRCAPYSWPRTGPPDLYDVPPDRQAFVELRGTDGSWSRYTGTEIVAQSSASDQNPDAITAGPLIALAPHAMGDVMLAESVDTYLGQSSLGDLDQPMNLSIQPTNASTMGSPASIESLQLFPDLNPEMFGDEWKLYWPMPGSQNAEDALVGLESVLPEALLGNGTASELRMDKTRPALHVGLQTLLYSAVNSFAGLQTVPLGSLFAMIWQEPKLQSQATHLLRSSPASVAKSLADSLFRASVESCDAEAVSLIMAVTNTSPHASIDPDGIKCRFEGRAYTPIELAAKLNNLQMVQILLTANADPNKTYSQDGNQDCGALELAVRQWGEYESVVMRLVKLLLQSGAMVRMELVESVVKWGNGAKKLLEEMLDQALNLHHEKLFDRGLVLNIAKQFENSDASRIIERFIRYCETKDCARCAPSHPEMIQETFNLAAFRGNFELVRVLLPFAKASSAALAGAVRSQNSQLVDYLLSLEASLDDPVLEGDLSRQGILTPMAEAIIAKDQSRIDQFEELGGLLCLAQKHHFSAAMAAAVSTGNTRLVHRLFELAPAYYERELSFPLIVAIHCQETDLALLFLDAGAFPEETISTEISDDYCSHPLVEVLRQRNRPVWEAMVQADEAANELALEPRSRPSPAMKYAAEWGDTEILERLFSMGFHPSEEALLTSITSGNMPILWQLLERRTSMITGNPFQESILEVAVRNKDRELICQLISKGVPIADSRAFEYALDNDELMFEFLIDSFMKVHPSGSESFGGRLVAKAIMSDKFDKYFRIFFQAKFSILSICYIDMDSKSSGLNQFSAIGYAVQHKEGTCLDIVRRLLSGGGDPNSIGGWFGSEGPGATKHREPLLNLAIQTRNMEMVTMLVERGADVNRSAR